MTTDQLTARAIAQLGTVDLGKLSKGRDALDERDWRGIDRARRIIETGSAAMGGEENPLPLFITDQSGMTISDIRAAHRAARRRYGRPPGLLVVDYLQLMHSIGRVESRQVEVTGFAYGLKDLGKELETPVLAMAQLNRGPSAANRKPRISDLRESGAIEQAADAIACCTAR
jgi:replicative DNA helicase